MGQRQKRNCHVLLRAQLKITAYIDGVRAKIRVRQHHALRFASSSRSVDDGCELAGKHLRGAHAVRGDFRSARGSDQSFVA